MEAAADVFAKDGYESATMKRIAEVCGVTKVTVYAHFRDKARLYKAVMDGHVATMPALTLGMGAGVELSNALACIDEGIQVLASHPSCQAFCQTLMRSELDKNAYLQHWNAVLQPYLNFAIRALANASPGSNNATDGEKFLRLIVAENGLLQTTVPMSASETTVGLFARAYAAGCSGRASSRA